MVSGLMNVQAAAKTGSKCQKFGIKTKVGGTNFICAKSGKKLLWKPVNTLPAKVVIDVKKLIPQMMDILINSLGVLVRLTHMLQLSG